MVSSSGLSVSSPRPHAQAGSKVAGKGRLPSSDHAASLHELKTAAARCQTPRQFRQLIDGLQILVPFQCFSCSWSYPRQQALCYFFTHGMPIDFLRWYLAKGLFWKSPLFKDWVQAKTAMTAVVFTDALRRLRGQYDEAFLEEVERRNMQHALVGGGCTDDLLIHFALTMRTDNLARLHLKTFKKMLPALCDALRRAHPHQLLTKRETAVLERRAMGEITKQIAGAEGISERTVREHLQQIKKKLYTDDLVNAVVIAIRSGMLGRSSKHGPAVHR